MSLCKTRVIAHSLGTLQLQRRLDILQQDHPELYHPENLDIVFMSPAGFFPGLKGAATFANRYRVGTAQTLCFPPFDKIPSFERGVDSLALIPVDDVDTVPNDAYFSERLYQLFPDRSHYTDRTQLIEFVPERDYIGELSYDDFARLAEIDAQLEEIHVEVDFMRIKGGDPTALETLRQKRKDVDRLLRQRGTLLAPYLDHAFRGDYYEGHSKPMGYPEAQSKARALLGLSRLLIDMFRSKPLKALEELQKRGVTIRYIIPEFDGFFHTEDVPGEDPDITILEQMMHASWYFRPEILVAALQHFDEQSASEE